MPQFSRRVSRLRGSEIREILKWINANVISFGGGLPDPATFPAEDIANIVAELMRSRAAAALQYSVTLGVEELRRELARFMERRGVRASHEDIVVTSGSQQGIYIIAKLFLDPGDAVIVENPTYLAALQVFDLFEARTIGIPMDENGMRTDVLEERLRRLVAEGVRPKLIYVVPTAHNPTGITMSQERRRHLLELADRYDMLVVEDDPYSHISFAGEPPPALKALDESGRVIYLSTASKILVPGLRIGWMIAPQWLMTQIEFAKQAMDLHTPTLSQYIMAEALRRGVVDKTIARAREIYRAKRDAMLDALDRYMAGLARWTRPISGMFIWVELSGGLDAEKLLRVAVEKYGVAFVPGKPFHVEGGENTLRLNFTYPTLQQIEEGIRRLAEAVREFA